ncbi:diphosphate--fructose-6-phosphate 1-phosphotransferase [Spirochaeta thermophila]|uniref:Pyrophosphate--fructose 6-phosphate 1-phosphotransferase n=1 Tax=Winmispira thermophila (strain ATCC 49972 / DSM 6192 / RI 19.B1) TaxID=665571 RepID=E0RNV7_WINT6|nr:diphosphate--fructose-6-phosphate 1-phosphotransferase [Spirochaeta thermophila]ADN01230.1 putative phosphofruktokinase [Spirochaeta thermophila DSM 6192]
MKGAALVGQSGGPTSVINASLAGIIEGVRERSGGRIYGMRFGIEGFLEGDLLDLSSLPDQEVGLLKATPGSALGSTRRKLTDEDLPRVRELLEKYDIRYLFLIGGNDTMETIHRVEAYCRRTGYELFGVGVPKTVDNDLVGTDHTPGYPSAARYVALSVLQGGRLAADMQRVDKFAIYQTVGRDTGWLAAASVVAKRRPDEAPHLICVPERPLTLDRFLADVERAIASYGYCYIVVGEGVVWEDGTPVSASQEKDSFSNIEFGAMGGASAALTLHRILKDRLGLRGEFQIPESLAMCASDRVSAIDREEAYACGRKAVTYASEGRSGIMVTIERSSSKPYRFTLGSIPLGEVARKTKPMPDEFLTPEGHFVSEAFEEYIRPLVGDIERFARLF